MKTVILLSGGIDSTVLLAARIRTGDDIIPITFDYGQTHRKEISAAHHVAHHYGLTTRVFTLPTNLFGPSAILGHTPIPHNHAEQPDTTTVPGRNLVMLTFAAAVAAKHHAAVVFIGANLDDAAGYIDCRPEFIRAIDDAVSLGTGRVSISAPLLSMTKTDIITYGQTLDAPLDLTWSCYRGGDQPCGCCGACLTNQAAMA